MNNQIDTPPPLAAAELQSLGAIGKVLDLLADPAATKQAMKALQELVG